jgi:RNA polymerase I-specific transcription initiation factor RRN3
MDMEDLENSQSSNPSKRVKVEFSDEVEVRLMHDWELAPAFVREEVRRALEERASGEYIAYDKIVQLFKPEEGAEFEPPMKNLRSYIVGLTSSAASLTRSCSTLIGAILQSDWIRRDESYFTLVLRFFGHLVSAQGVWLGDVLRMLVGYMTISEFTATASGYQIRSNTPQTHQVSAVK